MNEQALERPERCDIGVVIIGRNEGDRLARCLTSVADLGYELVYSDSGSSDGSPDLARERGVHVVQLDPARPFTAARGRNEGFKHLLAAAPWVRYVQFIDGDCELFSDWPRTARSWLEAQPNTAIVCGRLHERHPERSVYNRLCDAEWDRAPGAVLACGGIFMARADAVRAVGGFREDLPAGEEPELCHRLRQSGWVIWRLADSMAWHDAAMLRFSQWWNRNCRTGFGYAHTLATVRPVERHHVRGVASAWMWAAIIPVLLGGLFALAGPWAWPAFLIYPVQVARQALRAHGTSRQRLERGFFLLLGRFPELLGQFQYVWGRYGTGRSFDYKKPAGSA